MTTVRLRPEVAADFPLPDANSEFDDFGPRRLDGPAPCRIDQDGHLAVEADGELVGSLGWHWVGYGPNQGSRAAMLGITIYPGHRGKGYGTEAQRLATTMLFDFTTINRVEASTDVDNVAEQRALEKLGFTREGVNRGAQFRGGRFCDLVMYSVLRAEWT